MQYIYRILVVNIPTTKSIVTGELSVATRRCAFMGSGALSLKIPSMCIGADGASAAALKRRLAISACRAPILRARMGLTALKVLGRVGLTALKVAR